MTPTRGFRSLTSRLITWVLLACGGVFLLTAGYSNTRARRMAEELAGSEAEAEARRVVADLVGGLRRIEEATRLLATAVETLERSAPGQSAPAAGGASRHPITSATGTAPHRDPRRPRRAGAAARAERIAGDRLPDERRCPGDGMATTSSGPCPLQLGLLRTRGLLTLSSRGR